MRDLHCAHARFVWNLAVEQQSWWRPGRGSAPGLAQQQRQLAQARAAEPWLAEGSSSIQQQALRDFDKAMAAYLDKGNPARRPGFRSRRGPQGFVIRDTKVRRLSRKWGEVFVPKCGWVRFRWTRPLPDKPGMARVTLDRAGRWHVSFPAPQPAVRRQSMVRRPAPEPDPDQPGAFLPNRARAKAGLNRGILASCWGLLARRLEQKAAASGVTVVFVDPRFTSQQCRVCGHTSRKNRESQAVFRCQSCGHADHADVNAARNILARGLATINGEIPARARGQAGVRPHKTPESSGAAGTIQDAA